MKWLSLLLLSCMLSSCMPASEVGDAIDGINSSIAAIEESLSKECKTKAIELQIESLRKQIASVETKCDLVVDKTRHDKTKWKTATIGLLILIGVWVLKKVAV